MAEKMLEGLRWTARWRSARCGRRGATAAGYRYVNGVELPGMADEDPAGVTYTLQFKFGNF